MKKTIILFFILSILQSCSKKECCIPGDDVSFMFSLINKNGEDLLDKNTQNTYNTDSIKLYDLIDGKAVLINNPDRDVSKGYLIVKKDDELKLNAIRLFFERL